MGKEDTSFTALVLSTQPNDPTLTQPLLPLLAIEDPIEIPSNEKSVKVDDVNNDNEDLLLTQPLPPILNSLGGILD